MAQAVNLDSDSPSLDSPGIRFDDQGMIVPHSILGRSKDFRTSKGETKLVKPVPMSQRSPAGRHRFGNVRRDSSSDHRKTQSNALQHWQTHMGQRRKQLDFLSDKLNRSSENLLMNQYSCFRETQEQEFLSQAVPHIHSAYGYQEGTEFWRLPQNYGDEISGIRATLTKTEQGRRGPVTHVGQPKNIRQELGILRPDSLDPASLSWSRTDHLQHQFQERAAILKDMDMKKPDISGLEVIGSNKSFVPTSECRRPVHEETEEQTEMKAETLDNVEQTNDGVSGSLHIPALRFCGEVARWTGNSTAYQEELAISKTLLFEAATGETASAHLELHNVGSTAIFYSWQQIPVPHSQLLSQWTGHYFYFNRSPDVIIPGATKHVDFAFKSELPGIKTETWQLSTHPVLLQGASMQVMLKGYAVYKDRDADKKLLLERKQQQELTYKMCQSIVCRMLQGVHTPERPSSPQELYITEEEDFVRKNPKWQHLDKPVGELKRLWHEVNPEHTWDLSIETLQQAILSLPLHGSTQSTTTREEGLRQLNCFLLELTEPHDLKCNHPTPDIIGQQLWRNLLDSLEDEATRLRQVLGLPVSTTWIVKEPLIPDADPAVNKDDKRLKKGGAAAKPERKVGKPQTPTADRTAELNVRKKGEKKEEVGKGRGKQTPGPPLKSPRDKPPEDKPVHPEIIDIYQKFLHKKVYALMEELVDTFCDMMDEGEELEISI